jgi:hypothetical protein
MGGRSIFRGSRVASHDPRRRHPHENIRFRNPAQRRRRRPERILLRLYLYPREHHRLPLPRPPMTRPPRLGRTHPSRPHSSRPRTAPQARPTRMHRPARSPLFPLGLGRCPERERMYLRPRRTPLKYPQRIPTRVTSKLRARWTTFGRACRTSRSPTVSSPKDRRRRRANIGNPRLQKKGRQKRRRSIFNINHYFSFIHTF